MIIGFFDIPRSTPMVHTLGHKITVAIRAQLDEVVGRNAEATFPEIMGRMFANLPDERAPVSTAEMQVFRAGEDLKQAPRNPGTPQRYRGGRQGDGMMIGTPQKHAITMLQTAMEMQEERPWQHMNRPNLPDWVGPMYVALGICRVTWDGIPYESGAIPNGDDISLLGKLLKVEPEGCVVLNAKLCDEVRQYANHLYHLIEMKRTELPGIKGEISYGRVPVRPLGRVPIPVMTWWKCFVSGRRAVVILTLGAVAWGHVAWWMWL